MSHQEQYLQTPQYLRAEKIAARLDISKASLYRFVRAGKFPKPIKLSTGTSVWPLTAVDDFIKKQSTVS